ncbi:MAG: hypothetical protein AB7I41_24360 [Candidatus Sericytochromatia bacterium]
MADFRLGSHDRGMLDSADILKAKRTPLRTGLSATDAQAFARSNGGSEMLLKTANGTYNVYAVTTSEAGKAIKGSDFEDGTADISLTPQDVARLGGTKAYLQTDDGTLRTLEIAGIQLDNLDQSLIRADLNVNIQDKDGIETKSARDITGTLSGKVVIDRAMLEWALAQAEKETGLKFTLSDNPRDQSYKINASYGVGLGSITIKPTGTGLKVEVGGLAGGLADAGDWLGKKLGYDPQLAVDKLIRQHLGANLGLKVESQSLTEYTLAPDLKNNPLMRDIPLSGQTSFKVEEIKLNATQGNGFRIDTQGNLELNFNHAQVIGSTDSRAQTATPDREGPDQLSVKVQAQLGNDFSSQVEGEAGISVDVTPAEQAGLKARIREFTGQEIGAGGQFEVSGLRFSAQANAQGKITKMDQTLGQLKFERLALDAQGVQVDLSAQNGVLQGELKDGQYRLDAENITLKGSVNTPQGKLNVTQLQLSGELAVDPTQPQKLNFTIPTGENIRFSGQFAPTGQSQGVKIQNLNVGPAQFNLDAGQGKLTVAGQGQGAPRISLGALTMPEATIRNLQVTGPMQADLNRGTLSLQARSMSLSGKVGPLDLTRLSGSGNLNWDPAKGLEITNANISAQGKLGELDVKQLKGAGNISVSPTGQVRFSSTRDLSLQTGMGLSVRGNLALDYTPGQVQVETTSNSPVLIDYTDKNQGIDLQGLAYRGRMSFNEQSGELRLSSHPDKPLELKSGSISGVGLKDLSLSNGQVSVQTQGGKFVAEPLPGQTLTLNGKIQGISLKDLQSQGPVKFDPAKQSIAWDQPVSASLPDQGIDQLSTQGPVEISQDAQGRMHFRSPGGTISLKMGQLNLSNFKVEGEAILDPRTGQLSFSGLDGGQGLKLDGTLNGYPIKAESSGQLHIQHTPKGVELTGEKLKLNGLVDGFTLQSPEGASGKVLITPDGGIDLKELNFDVTIDDMQFQNRNGLFKTTPQGFEINLSGDINAKQEQLLRFLQKFSGRQDIGKQAQDGIKQALGQLQNHFGTFNKADIHYENMVIRFDKNFQFQGFEVLKDTRIDNAQVNLSLGRKPEKVNIGELHWRAEAEADSKGFRVKDGDIEFSLTQNIRDYIDRTVTQQLSDAGLKDVDLEVSPSGEISIKNATYEVRAKGRSGNNGTEIDIPLLSRLFKKPKKVMNISAKLDITPRIENNQLVVELDNLKLKGLLAQIINSAIDGEDKLADQMATQLRAEDIKFERKDGESLFRLDLNDLLKKQMDPNINLTSAELSPEGKVRVGYTYGQSPAGR